MAVRQAQPNEKLCAALYVYSVDSPFVNVVNQYMSSAWSIVPPHSEAQVISLFSNHSSWINNKSVELNFSIPITAMNVTFLDQTD